MYVYNHTFVNSRASTSPKTSGSTVNTTPKRTCTQLQLQTRTPGVSNVNTPQNGPEIPGVHSLHRSAEIQALSVA